MVQRRRRRQGQGLTEIVHPYGTMLKGTSFASTPLAIYLSSDGEFLARTDRPCNFWFHTHYLNGVRLALFERFKGQVDWLDDADVLAGRLEEYRVVICPIFRATTDRLLARLKEYQAAAGLIVGDELWRVDGLTPNDTFPRQDPAARNGPYANEDLWRWHQANRDAIRGWWPKGLLLEEEMMPVATSSPDMIPVLRESRPVRYVVVANNRFKRGDFAERHGYVGRDYLDQGVAQEIELLALMPGAPVVYEVLASRQDVSGIYPVRNGVARIPFGIPLGAGPGTWTIAATDLTSGLTAKVAIAVEGRQGR